MSSTHLEPRRISCSSDGIDSTQRYWPRRSALQQFNRRRYHRNDTTRALPPHIINTTPFWIYIWNSFSQHFLNSTFHSFVPQLYLSHYSFLNNAFSITSTRSTSTEKPRPEITLSPPQVNLHNLYGMSSREFLDSNDHDQISVLVPFRLVCWVERSHWVLGYYFLHLAWVTILKLEPGSVSSLTAIHWSYSYSLTPLPF